MAEFRMIDTGPVQIRTAVEGAGPLVLMVHGFPESWYSWRHQLGPVAAAGFTAAAIDVRGYGGSDKPGRVEDYAMEHLVSDIDAVAQALQPDRPAILVGHDWGAPQVWNAALTRPDRFRAVAALSVPAHRRRHPPVHGGVSSSLHQQGPVLLSGMVSGGGPGRDGGGA